MATIGNDLIAFNYALDANIIYAHALNGVHLAITEAHEVGTLYIYQAGLNNTGKTAEIGIFDVTDGVENSTLVGSSHEATGTGTKDVWLSIDLTGIEIALPANRTYGIQIFTDGWDGRAGGTWITNASVRRSGETGLVSPFVSNTTSYSSSVSVYATATPVVADTVTITSVNAGATIASGDVDVTIIGTGFSTVNTVTISPSQDIDDVDAVNQVLTRETTTEIDITVSLPTGANSFNPVYLFVTNSTSAVSSPFSTEITPASASLHTLWFTDDGTITGNDVICESTLGFHIGVTAFVYRSGVTEEQASLIEAVSTLATATPQYNVTYPNGEPIAANSDTIKFVYAATAGDIKSVTGGVALPSGEFGVLVSEVC